MVSYFLTITILPNLNGTGAAYFNYLRIAQDFEFDPYLQYARAFYANTIICLIGWVSSFLSALYS